MAQSASGLGPKMRNQGVGVPVPHIVLGFQDGDHRHMFLIRHACQNRQPVVDGFAIGLFDGWKVGSGPFYRVISSHRVISLFAFHGYSHRTNGMARFRHCCKLLCHSGRVQSMARALNNGKCALELKTSGETPAIAFRSNPEWTACNLLSTRSRM